MGPHQLCWGSSGTWSSSVTAPTPRLGGFALLLRRAWLQTSRDKAAWIWGKASLDLIQGGAVCWVIVVCPREIFTSCFCCFNLIWEVFTSSYYYYIYGFPIATGDFANCIWGLSLKPCGSMLFMFLPSFLPWRGGMMSRRMRTLEFFEFRFMTLNLMYTYTLWQDEHISLTVEQMSYIHCGRKFRDNSGYSA